MKTTLLALLGLAVTALVATGTAGDVRVLDDDQATAYLAGQVNQQEPGEIDPVEKTPDCFPGTDSCLGCNNNFRCTKDAMGDVCKDTEEKTTCKYIATFTDCGVLVKYSKPNCAGLPQVLGINCAFFDCQ